ncbi:Hint domain-containing protein [Dyella tabacisoli]|uniref:Hint domain-containing protein n=1 Tax=Dyella tabacisoli TaxID=2282381 RepID=A0A369UQF2_9GAMM|nr:Hint domain-containing protein [Dyella tabacisoli]RDD83002.1 hypothetical protein DVJ77_03905 [Dyella tabacisoli]
MSSSPNVSAATLSTLSTFHASIPSGQPTALNPADPIHNGVIQAALQAAGRTPERYPGLYASLDGGKADTTADHVKLVDAGPDRSGRASALTWHANDRDILYAGASLFALDGDNNELLSFGANSNVGDGLLQVSTQTATAKPVKKSLNLLSVNHSVGTDGSVRFTALAGKSAALDASDPKIQITAPVITKTGHTAVVIALGRDSANPGPDPDYTYTEPQNLDTPYLIVPFSGQALLSYPINGTPGQPIPNAVLSTYIYFATTSGPIITINLNSQYTPSTRLQNGTTVDPFNPNVVQWDYPADGQSYSNTQSLVFNPQSLVNESASYFLFQFQIPVTNAPYANYSFAVCSTGTPNEPSVYCYNINKLMFWWHCLAAGTQVALAGGGTAAIESLNNTQRVNTGVHNGNLAVEATLRGPHESKKTQSGPSAVYRLRTADNRELIATGAHPIMTPTGPASIGDLQIGQTILVENGTSTVASCEAIDYSGSFYDLKLGNEQDRAAGYNETVGTYVANGIVVGDHAAMKAHKSGLRRNLAYMQTRTSSTLHQDYASALADVQY